MPSTYDKIEAKSLGSAAASVSFTSIPATYTDLVLIVEGIATSGSTSALALQFNGDTSSAYSGTRLSGNGSAASSDRYTATTVMGGGLITSSVRFNNIINIQNYSNTTTYKTVLFRANVSDALVRSSVNNWINTSAINRADVFAVGTTFATGSTFTLYGIKAA